MSESTVSVVIPTRNHGRLLEAAVASVLDQPGAAVECIVADDGSTDDTPQRMRRLAGRVRYLRLTAGGVARARNAALAAARGDLVAFLDDDDRWLPGKLERQLPLLADPGVGVVYGSAVIVDAAGCRQRTRVVRRAEARRFADAVRVRNPVPFSTAVVRRAALGAEPFDPSLPCCVDWDLWLRLAGRWRFDCCEEPLVEISAQPESVSSSYARMRATMPRLFRRYLWPSLRRPRDLGLLLAAYSHMYYRTSILLGEDARGRRLRDTALSLAIWPLGENERWAQALRLAVGPRAWAALGPVRRAFGRQGQARW